MFVARGWSNNIMAGQTDDVYIIFFAVPATRSTKSFVQTYSIRTNALVVVVSVCCKIVDYGFRSGLAGSRLCGFENGSIFTGLCMFRFDPSLYFTSAIWHSLYAWNINSVWYFMGLRYYKAKNKKNKIKIRSRSDNRRKKKKICRVAWTENEYKKECSIYKI